MSGGVIGYRVRIVVKKVKMVKDKITESDIHWLLRCRHPSPEWIYISELRNSTGFVRDVRTIDAAVFNTWPGRNFRTIAYEIKTSRSDFLAELKNPEKRSWVEESFNETNFACLNGICDMSEIPELWGLLIVSKNGNIIRQKKAACYRETSEMDYNVLISAMRRMYEIITEYRNKVYSFEGDALTQESLSELVKNSVQYEKNRLNRELDKARSKTRELKDMEKRLIEPLRELKYYAEESCWHGKPVEKATIEDVKKWAAKLESGILKRRLEGKYNDIRDARDALTEIMDQIDMENLKMKCERDG